ncbi:MAG: MarR family transcriptional regulator [Gammaproteobacteria bacterium]|jgi:DNA-binding MarR family transcriptional regulator|nr:MAG: MarR family transcriptional regulator [Gammaproteobacteria bacterium]
MSRKETSASEQAIAFEFFTEIGIIGQLGSNRMQRALPHGLNQSQFSVLNWFVRVDDQATPTRLARAFQVTPGAMTNTLAKLSSKGFVAIEPDPHSGRSKIVTLTDEGRVAREAAIAALGGDLEEFLEAFPASRLKKALPLLRQARAFLDAARD